MDVPDIHASRSGSAADFGARLGNGDAQQDPLLALHRGAVGVPVGVLARDVAVVGDEAVHGLGKLDDLDRALQLCPLAVEAVGEGADPGPGVAAEVPDLVGGLPGADQY